MRHEVAQPLLQRRRRRVQVHEHEALPGLDPDPDQPELARLKSSRSSVCLARTATRRGRRSGVVRALEADRLPARFLDDGGARDGGRRCRPRRTSSRPRTTMSGSSSTVARKYVPGVTASSSRPTTSQSRRNHSSARSRGWPDRDRRDREQRRGPIRLATAAISSAVIDERGHGLRGRLSRAARYSSGR